MRISLIAAVSANGIIGAKGDLPWKLPDDMKFFSGTTRGHHVLMGRVNYESIPPKYRPLPERENLVISRKKDYISDHPKTTIFSSIEAGIDFARAAGEEELFIIGGGEIYAQTIDLVDRLYITHVHATIDGDTSFPTIDKGRWEGRKLSNHAADDVHNFSFDICLYDKKV